MARGKFLAPVSDSTVLGLCLLFAAGAGLTFKLLLSAGRPYLLG